MPDRMSERPIVWIAGVGWDDMPGTDKRMAIVLADLRPILWVDSPRAVEYGLDGGGGGAQP